MKRISIPMSWDQIDTQKIDNHARSIIQQAGFERIQDRIQEVYVRDDKTIVFGNTISFYKANLLFVTCSIVELINRSNKWVIEFLKS